MPLQRKSSHFTNTGSKDLVKIKDQLMVIFCNESVSGTSAAICIVCGRSKQAVLLQADAH